MHRTTAATLLLSLLFTALVAGCLGDEKSPRRAATATDDAANASNDDHDTMDDLAGDGPTDGLDDGLDDALVGSDDAAPAPDAASDDRPAAPHKEPCPRHGALRLRIAILGVGVCV